MSKFGVEAAFEYVFVILSKPLLASPSFHCELGLFKGDIGMEKGLKMSCPLKQMETTPSQGGGA
ncbi:unnamed protein product [Prunus armeniaca]